MGIHEINRHGMNEWDLSKAESPAAFHFFDSLLDFLCENDRLNYVSTVERYNVLPGCLPS